MTQLPSNEKNCLMKKAAPLLVLALLVFALAACGEEERPQRSMLFDVDPGGGNAYSLGTEASTRSGDVRIRFTNRQPEPHDVSIEDADGELLGKTDVIVNNETSTTIPLDPGEYTFYCSVDGHRDEGMEGTLTVRE